MKVNLENNIKESLREFEMPYDPSAWSAMSSRLDQVLPSTPKSNFKWYLGGAATVAVIATTVILWPSEEAKKTTQLTVKETASKQTEESVANVQSEQKDNKIEATENSASNKTYSAPKQYRSSESYIKGSERNDQNVNDQVIFNGQKDNTTPNPNVTENVNTGGNSNVVKIPSFENICLGESFTFTNENGVDIILTDASGNKVKIAPNKTITFKPETEGAVNVSYQNNSEKLITVYSRPKADFQIEDAYSYENGIPVTTVKATTTGVNYNWEVEKQNGSISGKEASLHFFHKGTFDITVKVTGSNGCSATETKQIRIDEEYNLLAVNAFDPNSSDIRKSSFIPYALTQRAVDFRMIIIDPADGAIIFETNDASNPWKGNDKRNGQLVDPNKAYIWKVVLNNPVKGEKSEYKGTITRL